MQRDCTRSLTVVRARAMGMCFGVLDALEITTHLRDPETVTIHGELVHNEEVLGDLSRRGFRMMSETARARLPATDRVMITAHGLSETERQRLTRGGKSLIDTTCPLVKAVHRAAQQLAAEDRFVVVIGKPAHVEVRGIVGDLTQYAVVDQPSDVRAWNTPRIGIVCQSTASPEEAGRMVELIVEKNPQADVRYIDSICSPTRERQEAMDELLKQVDAVVIVGGRQSNNTRELVLKAHAKGIPAIHIQTAEDLDPEWFQPLARIGLSAGTSTPQSIIDEVHERLLVI